VKLTTFRNFGSWTKQVTTRRFGIALLFYKPDRRLSVSVWCPGWSHNVRLWGRP
jgi:hypothetical protein